VYLFIYKYNHPASQPVGGGGVPECHVHFFCIRAYVYDLKV
jgi:hypothetical protein